MTITLPADLQAFVDEQVELGNAPDAQALVVLAVRLLQQKMDAADRPMLLAALAEAEAEIAAGKVLRGPFNARQMLGEIRQKRATEAVDEPINVCGERATPAE